MLMNHLHSSEAPPRRLCDFCSVSTAVVYCRADSAKLCLACDRQVHSTNQLFTKHARWLLCDSCDSTPATIFCRSHASVMCQNCDWEAHPSQGGHERRPLEGFSGCPSVSELVGILGFDELGKKPAPVNISGGSGNGNGDGGINGGDGNGEGLYGFSDFLVWETPSVVSLDDLIRPDDSSSGHSFQSIGVPPLPKNRNATCGQYKEEILSQIREMSKLEPNISHGQADVEPLCGFQFFETEPTEQSRQQPERVNNNEQPKEANSVGWFTDKVDVTDQDLSPSLFGSFVEMNDIVPDKDSEVGDSSGHINPRHEDHSHPPGTGIGQGTESVQVLPRVSFRELNSQERDSAITRYKEKKKTRRYEKHIRYETRKVRAESRTRIRGRFAKMERS